MTRTTVSALALIAALAPAAAAAEEAEGKLLFESRLRYESVDQEGVAKDADAATVRARVGWESPKVGDFRMLVEGEVIAALIDDYSDPVNPDPLRPTVADSPIMELNRAQVTWTGLPDTELVLGRQRLVFGNARFVGNVGWRQNEQTFDAVKLASRAFAPVTLTYAWAGRVNRPLGREHPAGIWTGDVHAMSAEAATPLGQLTGYGFLIDLREAPALSSRTWGLRLAGSRPVGDGLSATWEAEYARQGDWGANPASYTVDYRLAALGLKAGRWSAAAVYEQLEGDGAHAFQTPLASGHGFQGWSDVIGTTPAFGVRDLFVRAEAAVDAGFDKPLKLKAEAHDFRDSAGDIRIGRELDLSVMQPFGARWSVELKAARFEGQRPGFPDTTKGWLILEYRY